MPTASARALTTAALVGIACDAGTPLRPQVSTSGTANPAIGASMTYEHTSTPIDLGITVGGVGTSGTLNVIGAASLSNAAVVTGMGSLGSGTITDGGTLSSRGMSVVANNQAGTGALAGTVLIDGA